MKWKGQRQSDNVEDAGSMGRLAPVGGIGALVLGLVIYFLGGDPSVVLDTQPTRQPSSVPGQNNSQRAPINSEERQFVSVVLADTEDVWGELFRRMGRRYRQPKIVLFSGSVRSACGVAGSSTGPFYCPSDEKMYLDLDFFRELKSRYKAPGDFAQAYVIAHEVGHHVQNQLGTMDQVEKLQARASKTQSNQISVRLELQADYYAGVWAHYAQKRNLLEVGDVEEALTAASAIGDDKLQRESSGNVVPDSFTHGTSQQRMTWFQRGLQAGNLQNGNTFRN